MSLSINTSVFENPDIREALDTIKVVASRRKLGIKRWDNVLDMYPFSGTVVVPVKLGYRVHREPFYFVVEKVNQFESLRIKPVRGDQWSIGDVYGFFGLHAFEDYVYGMPILVVEGVSDWAVCKRYYKYVLATLTAKVTYRHAFYLSNLTGFVFVGYDSDEAGCSGRKMAQEVLGKLGCGVGYHLPAQNDWAAMFENEFGSLLLDQSMNNLLEKINKVNMYVL